MWLGDVPRAPTLGSSDFAEGFLDVELRRVGSTLSLRSPVDFGSGDPFDGPFGDFLRTRAAKVSGGVVDEVSWEFDPEQRPVRRAQSGDLDVYAPGDPLLGDYAGILGSLRSRIPAGTAVAAREAVGALRLIGASRHRLWFAAPTAEARDALGKVPGARAALVTAIQAVQKHEVPLYRVVVDGSYRAKGMLL